MTKTGFSLLPAGVAAMPFGEKFVLWAMRVWADAEHTQRDPHNMLCNGFKLAGAASAYPSLDSVMTVLQGASPHCVGVRLPPAADVSVGEQRVLGAIAALQNGGGQAAVDRYLGCWLPPAALRLIFGPLVSLTASLAQAGLFIRPRTGMDHEDTQAGPNYTDDRRKLGHVYPDDRRKLGHVYPDDRRKLGHVYPDDRRKLGHVYPDDRRKLGHVYPDDRRKLGHVYPDDRRKLGHVYTDDRRKLGHVRPGRTVH